MTGAGARNRADRLGSLSAMRRRHRARAGTIGGVVLTLLLAACGGTAHQAGTPGTTGAGASASPTTAAPAPTSTVPAYQTYTAAIAKDDVRTVGIYDAPGDDAPTRSLRNPN